MARRLLIVACLLLLSASPAPAVRAQTPTSDAMTAARSLVTTMKLADQYKALLPAILLGLKPALTQDRPEIERDYDAMMPMIADAFTPYYTSMVDGIAADLRHQLHRCRTARHRGVLSPTDRTEDAGKDAGDQPAGARGRPGDRPQGGGRPEPASHRGAASEGTQAVAREEESGRRSLSAQTLIDHQPARQFQLAQCARNEAFGRRMQIAPRRQFEIPQLSYARCRTGPAVRSGSAAHGRGS